MRAVLLHACLAAHVLYCMLSCLSRYLSRSLSCLRACLSQLVPLLRRSVRLAADAPKKLLLLAVVDHEPSEASEAELTAIAAAQLEQLWSRVNGPEASPLVEGAITFSALCGWFAGWCPR